MEHENEEVKRPRLTTEDAQELNHCNLLVSEDEAFRFYSPKYNLFGSGFEIEDAAFNLLENIRKEQNSNSPPEQTSL